MIDTYRPQWHRNAACHGQTSSFFPKRGQPIDDARAICAACPVLDQCREYVTRVAAPEMYGVWAGLSERQRRQLRRARRASST
ncbi:MAG: WhiB family transcriptional regulator [Actinobacteria bacterium]|nr:WhiB family transcriptional regulator [Actinomycetota bacterium]